MTELLIYYDEGSTGSRLLSKLSVSKDYWFKITVEIENKVTGERFQYNESTRYLNEGEYIVNFSYPGETGMTEYSCESVTVNASSPAQVFLIYRYRRFMHDVQVQKATFAEVEALANKRLVVHYRTR